LIERSFQELSVAIETVRIVEELVEIWPNKVCDNQVKANVYYKGHVERMRMDVCDLGKTEIILGMPWLAAHNPEINWETGEVKMTRCLPLYDGRSQKRKKVKMIATKEEEKIICWVIDNKED